MPDSLPVPICQDSEPQRTWKCVPNDWWPSPGRGHLPRKRQTQLYSEDSYYVCGGGDGMDKWKEKFQATDHPGELVASANLDRRHDRHWANYDGEDPMCSTIVTYRRLLQLIWKEGDMPVYSSEEALWAVVGLPDVYLRHGDRIYLSGQGRPWFLLLLTEQAGDMTYSGRTVCVLLLLVEKWTGGGQTLEGKRVVCVIN